LHHDPGYSWKLILMMGLSAFAVLGTLLASYFAERRSGLQASWPETKGTPVSLRVVELPSNPRFPYTYYAGECLVEYQVGGRSYRIWASGGLLDRDQGYVADQMTVCPIASYVVHYNPKDPQDARASRPDPFP